MTVRLVFFEKSKYMYIMFIKTSIYPVSTLLEKKFHSNLNLAISLTANSLSFNSANYKIIKNLSMMAYITKIQKSKFANIWFPEFDHSLEKVAKLNSMYIFILWGKIAGFAVFFKHYTGQ